ncbi:MAG TPA: sigma 54-interacting transcriptional regulator [Bacteriovoracaceae bacterium]|nr:sigma 54-interacting transcriptional regulator [Bacteriovoracaceae bacterium]
MKILVVDDEKLARINILKQFEESFTVIESPCFEDALRKIQNQSFDICYIDLKLDDSSELLGLKLIPEAVKKGFYTVVMTSIEDEETTELAYGLGCQDVYNKGKEEEHISETLNRYFLSKESFTEGYLFKDVIQTQNKKYKEDLKKVLQVIPTDIPICLLGESGTGKSHLARSIHDLSRRKGKFVELNCATFSGDTLKSELFGHSKGSFTGALNDKVGKLFEANHGTLFLDEIGSMSLEMQEGLLKAIEEKSFYPMGSNKVTKAEFRVICATLDDLEFLIKSGKFRFDLFQRISGFTFTLPTLRSRKEDIFPILKNKLVGSRKIIFKDDARKILENYEWPGNIRELLRFAEVISLSPSGVIREEEVEKFTKNSSFKRSRPLLQDHHYDLIRKQGLKEFLEQLSKEAVERSLLENENKARKAIAELQISSATFYRLQSGAFHTKSKARQTISLKVSHELQ